MNTGDFETCEAWVCTSLQHVHTIPSTAMPVYVAGICVCDAEMYTPPISDWESGQIILCSASDRLIAAQLTRIQQLPFLRSACPSLDLYHSAQAHGHRITFQWQAFAGFRLRLAK